MESAEARALEGLRSNFNRCNDEATAEVQPYDDKAELMQKLDALLLAPSQAELDALPDVFQLNAGDTTLKYAPLLASFGDFLWESNYWDSPEVGPVPEHTGLGNALSKGAVWREPVDPSPNARPSVDSWIYQDRSNWVLPNISCYAGEHRYQMVPIAIHHVNRLYYNIDAARRWLASKREPNVPTNLKKSLQTTSPFELPDDSNAIKARLEALSLSDWLEMLKPQMLATDAAGQLKTVVALPSDSGSGWALNMLAAENVKVALNLAAKRAPTEMNETVAFEVMSAMDTIREASQLVANGESWSVQRAMLAVRQGEAVFTVMGDWSFPDVGEGVGMIPFPGTQHALVYTIDGFVALDKHQASAENEGEVMLLARAWLRTVNDPDVAAQFAHTKGAISVGDWLSTEVKRCADEAFDAKPVAQDCWVVPAMSMSGQNCEAAAALLSWASETHIDKRKVAQLEAVIELTSCGLDAPKSGCGK
jgi:hypothetical protein